MRSLLCTLLVILLANISGYGQTTDADSLVFWKEAFKVPGLPAGWKNVDANKRGCEWLVTDQPYPGSFGYQQQAPPIASSSRGNYLQYPAGYIVDEDQPAWEKQNRYPDAYVETPAIDCSEQGTVILKFQQTFRWNRHKKAKDAGLFVGVSTDEKNWVDIPVMNDVPASTDMLTPLNMELNITRWAARRSKVYIRWFWKGIYGWYWMVDGIRLSKAVRKDIGIGGLVSHHETGNVFTKEDVLILKVKNNGSDSISRNFTVNCLVDGKNALKAIVPAGEHPLATDSEYEVRFPAVDLSKYPSHSLHFSVQLPGDQRPENDALDVRVNALKYVAGDLTNLTVKGNLCEIEAGVSRIRLQFYKEDIFRIWAAPSGDFSDPAGMEIATAKADQNIRLSALDKGDYYSVQSGRCTVRIYKKPLRFALYDRQSGRRIWEESSPLQFGATTVQQMIRTSDEQFYGCGMQNGSFSYRGRDVLIEKGGGWDAGGRPNPVPFYMSSNGYGVLRNTFDAGVYSFRDTLKFTHREDRFDAFYFFGKSFKDVLDEYTYVTGRPFLPPRWALSMGDANCYNRGAKGDKTKNDTRSGVSGTTPDVIPLVADQYVDHEMPRGWILPNDGYGCGYTKLDSVVKELAKRGFHTGLWTENGVNKIAREVGEYGTRLCKLDVAWVGPGYKFALDACRAAYEGIENNSDSRGFVWSVMGWAGTHRYSVVWTGDQSGNWEYIRFHIPTVIGSGLSAQNCATGDVDAIFGGSPKTYVRDLQWKCFTPVFMTMSGWAKNNKQPWIYGEPYTSINRKYLRLKMRLTPYMYTLMNEAYRSGVPAVRGLVLEYPDDPVTWGTATQYEYLLGQSLLVAPVYKDEEKRDSIYFPKGKWIDYWDGTAHAGKSWLNGYKAPLDKLPLFVRAGSIIPMYPQMDYD
ncbi:MAG TPA: TIM-barrel domain-containing protein, partial [Puia sp.]